MSLPTIPPADRAGNGLAAGERRRDRAHELLHSCRGALIRRIQRAFLRHLLDRGPATIDGVRELVPLPAGIDPRLVGAAVRAQARDSLIVSVGRERSQRPEAHARWLDRWAIRDQSEALDWLADHPELAEPGAQRMLFPVA